MAHSFPYTYVACPCSNDLGRINIAKRTSRDIESEAQDEEQTFEPGNPRSNFSLFPPEHLLYCEECHDIKCSRCITEEIICWYCPGCLFEVPSSSVKSDESRCSRNCFSCPICTTQLITACIGDKTTGPYVLSCNYCMWSSLDVGLQFESPNHMRSRIDNLGIGGIKKKSTRSSAGDSSIDRLRRNLANMSAGSPLQNSRAMTQTEDEEAEREVKYNAENASPDRIEPNAQFAALKAFYREQLASANEGPTGSLSDNFASPSSLTRIMNLYSNPGTRLSRSSKPQTTTMREALNLTEGFVLQKEVDHQAAPDLEYIDTVSPQQREFQYPRSIGTPDATDVSQLWPMSMKLRTKRNKRCAECKHILVKPEFKVTSTRYRVKLVALNYIPLISLRPVPVSGGLKPPGPDGTDIVLEPGKPSQWIMKLTNPLFENVNVSLGSPSVTPGKYGHRVTILCPQFSIGKNGDVWDDALHAGSGNTKVVSNTDGASEQVAGKIYESGKNWVSIVLEVIPSLIAKEGGVQLDEDEDVIEIPVRVRLEWTVADEHSDRTKKKADRVLAEGEEVDDGKRELAYWMVIGIGRVAT